VDDDAKKQLHSAFSVNRSLRRCASDEGKVLAVFVDRYRELRLAYIHIESHIVHSMRRVETESVRDVARRSIARRSQQAISSPKLWLSR
jgi:hypothetical protein